MSKPLGISQLDILRGKKITPGWYPALMKKVEDTTASTGAEGWIVSFTILGDGEFKGVPIDARFYENAPGFAAPLIAALQGKKIDEVVGNWTLDNGIGKSVMIYVQNGTYNGRNTNNITDFRPTGS